MRTIQIYLISWEWSVHGYHAPDIMQTRHTEASTAANQLLKWSSPFRHLTRTVLEEDHHHVYGHCCTSSTSRLEETGWAPKNHLVENNWRGRSDPESTHCLGEGERQGYLTSTLSV